MKDEIMYLNGNFFSTRYDSEYFTFLNKNNGLIYLKKGKDYYRQIDEDNPFAYTKDNSVSELKDLTRTFWYSISKYDDDGTDRLYEYIVNKLSKFKKPKDNYLYSINSTSLSKIDIYINKASLKIFMNELLYVPRRIKDEELRNFSILVAGDNVFIKFLRFLSDCAYEVIYDKNFNVIKEGQFNMFDKDLWDRLKNYECDEGK